MARSGTFEGNSAKTRNGFRALLSQEECRLILNLDKIPAYNIVRVKRECIGLSSRDVYPFLRVSFFVNKSNLTLFRVPKINLDILEFYSFRHQVDVTRVYQNYFSLSLR